MSAFPTATSNGYTIRSSSGVTTLVWGTDALLQSPAPANGPLSVNPFAGTGFYIVESVDEETDAEAITGENGTGQKAWRVIIKNGARWTISVQDDVTMVQTTVASQVQVIDAGALVPGTTTVVDSSYAIYNATVVASGERFTRKGAAMRNITVEKLTLVD